jgi:stage II sporulation protein D
MISRRLIAVAALALATIACVTFPEPRPFVIDSVGPSPARPVDVLPKPPDVWRERGLVAVRLAAAEERQVLFVERDGTREQISRSGRGVALGNGRVQDSIVIGEPGARSELVFEGRRYRGALVAHPHPRQGLRLENWVALEDYVEGVVASEVVLWDAPPALLEAQAVAARSYAFATLTSRSRAERAFLWDGVEDQAYRGVFVPDTASRTRRLDERLAKAVAATRARVLMHGRVPFDARFHASCGGHTTEGRLVFGPNAPLGPGVPCAGCADDPSWKKRLAASDLARAAEELGLERFGRPVPTRTDSKGRWLEVELRGPTGVHPLAALEMRRAFGWGVVPSTHVTSWTPLADGGAEVVGRGRGHGVGLCQDGARELAERGFDATSILLHYYPGAQIGPAVLPGATR